MMITRWNKLIPYVYTTTNYRYNNTACMSRTRDQSLFNLKLASCSFSVGNLHSWEIPIESEREEEEERKRKKKRVRSIEEICVQLLSSNFAK